MNLPKHTEFNYRGMEVTIYIDDYGQCYVYEICDQHGLIIGTGSCGTYNMDYESEPKYIIDEALDVITCNDNPHGVLRYANHEHTVINLQHRSQIIQTYQLHDIEDLDNIVDQAFDDLMAYCSTPEYIAAEKERLETAENC